MSRLVFTSETLSRLKTELLKQSDETCAILFGRSVVKHGGIVRLVGREIQFVADGDYLRRSPKAAQLSPEVVAAAAKRARRNGESIVFVHSHPFAFDEFSSIDDEGEKMLS